MCSARCPWHGRDYDAAGAAAGAAAGGGAKVSGGIEGIESSARLASTAAVPNSLGPTTSAHGFALWVRSAGCALKSNVNCCDGFFVFHSINWATRLPTPTISSRDSPPRIHRVMRSPLARLWHTAPVTWSEGSRMEPISPSRILFHAKLTYSRSRGMNSTHRPPLTLAAFSHVGLILSRKKWYVAPATICDGGSTEAWRRQNACREPTIPISWIRFSSHDVVPRVPVLSSYHHVQRESILSWPSRSGNIGIACISRIGGPPPRPPPWPCGGPPPRPPELIRRTPPWCPPEKRPGGGPLACGPPPPDRRGGGGPDWLCRGRRPPCCSAN
mmetsp:Transcript_20154/g.52294  ORF Transcript_20154/g.52294 Transcript_20154/m.52294 type:complete len:328 (-) Transcript_20154:148-1131(-)